MRGRATFALAIALAIAFALAFDAGATGFTDLGQDIARATETKVELDGYLRLRGELLYNLDLDRGVTPSGEPLFPVPPADPAGQLLTHADGRLRTDIKVYAPFVSLAVKLRVDVLDNLALGSAPVGPPVGTLSQAPPDTALRIKRAYGEALLPFGVLAAGRMGSHWGLGMLTNGGDCADCDSGDAADRVALITPLLGHIWAVSFDISASGPFTARRSGQRVIDIDPSDDVRTFSFAVMRTFSDLARERRRRAEKLSVEYGAYVSHRWQQNDIPASYLPLAQPVEPGPSQVVARGLTATAVDAWLRLGHPDFRIELEAALMVAKIEQATLVPGALFHEPVEALQYGAAVESEFRLAGGTVGLGLDLGLASGDPAPGFGVVQAPDAPAPLAGDLDGPQAQPPHDNRFDNFRFHPDYRVDRILFREIVGTVTDAFYVRPHLRWRALELGPGRLELGLFAVASWAVEKTSTPGGEHELGLEIDPTVAYVNDEGFSLVLEYAVLVPFAGLDNPGAGLEARPAQMSRLRLVYGF